MKLSNATQSSATPPTKASVGVAEPTTHTCGIAGAEQKQMLPGTWATRSAGLAGAADWGTGKREQSQAGGGELTREEIRAF